MYAIKGNKQLKITETERAAYLKLGYDIAVAEGNTLRTIEVAPAKTVPFSKYQELLDENRALKVSGESGSELQVRYEQLEKENQALQKKLAAAEKKLKETTGE